MTVVQRPLHDLAQQGANVDRYIEEVAQEAR